MSTLTMACGTGPDGQPSPDCVVEISKTSGLPLDKAEVCEAFLRSLRASLPADALATKTALRAAISMPNPHEISVTMTEKRGGQFVRHPDMAISVSDRKLRIADIEHLATEAAKLLAD